MAYGRLGHLGLIANAQRLAPVKPLKQGVEHVCPPNMEDEPAKEKEMMNRTV
jgi:hypothetical protein